MNQMMDTSNTYLVIGLYQDGKALQKYQEAGNRRQSEDALVRLEEILKKQNNDWSTIIKNEFRTKMKTLYWKYIFFNDWKRIKF